MIALKRQQDKLRVKEKKEKRSDKERRFLERLIQKDYLSHDVISRTYLKEAWQILRDFALTHVHVEIICSLRSYQMRTNELECGEEESDLDRGILAHRVKFATCETIQRENEPMATAQLTISDCPEDQATMIDRIFVDGICVFDIKDKLIWEKTRAEYGLTCKVPDSDENVVGATNLARRTCLEAFLSLETTDKELFLQFSQCLLTRIVPFLTDAEMINLAISSKVLKTICYKDNTFRARRKEAYCAVASLISKEKKHEKKKKVKQANVKKQAKKDGFARGGNDGMH